MDEYFGVGIFIILLAVAQGYFLTKAQKDQGEKRRYYMDFVEMLTLMFFFSGIIVAC